MYQQVLHLDVLAGAARFILKAFAYLAPHGTVPFLYCETRVSSVKWNKTAHVKLILVDLQLATAA